MTAPIPPDDPLLWAGARPLAFKFYLLLHRHRLDPVSEFVAEWTAAGATTPVRLGHHLQAKRASAAAWAAYHQLAADYAEYKTAFRARYLGALR